MFHNLHGSLHKFIILRNDLLFNGMNLLTQIFEVLNAFPAGDLIRSLCGLIISLSPEDCYPVSRRVLAEESSSPNSVALEVKSFCTTLSTQVKFLSQVTSVSTTLHPGVDYPAI